MSGELAVAQPGRGLARAALTITGWNAVSRPSREIPLARVSPRCGGQRTMSSRIAVAGGCWGGEFDVGEARVVDEVGMDEKGELGDTIGESGLFLHPCHVRGRLGRPAGRPSSKASSGRLCDRDVLN